MDIMPSNYQWNELNQLTKFTNNSQEYEYGYNYEGLRINKKTPEKEINYYYNRGKQTVSEIHSDGTNVSIIWSNKPLARIVNGKYYYYMYNGHNDVVQMIHENGKIANEYSYDEWGNQLTEREEVENPIRYTGQYYDKESGNYYLRARYYSSAFKRFISEDTYKGRLDKPLSLNLYGYCSGNPVMFGDPSGHWKDEAQYVNLGGDLGGGFGGTDGGPLILIEVLLNVLEGVGQAVKGSYTLYNIYDKAENSSSYNLNFAKKSSSKDKENKGKSVKLEAAVKGSKKHGIKWKEGSARAKKEGKPQGQWNEDDLEFATQRANELKPGESDYFNLPKGSKSIVHMPDGTIIPATKIWIRKNGTGTWHGYPMP